MNNLVKESFEYMCMRCATYEKQKENAELLISGMSETSTIVRLAHTVIDMLGEMSVDDVNEYLTSLIILAGNYNNQLNEYNSENAVAHFDIDEFM